jgi:hypothetical protein
MPARSSSPQELTPIAIRRSSFGDGVKGSFVISLVDAISSPEFYEELQKAESEYWNALQNWSTRIARIKGNKADPVERWRLADDITSFRNRLEDKWRLRLTNALPALSTDLGVSERSLELMLKLRRRFSLPEVKRSKIGWSKFQELVDIRNDIQMKRCLDMITRKELKTDGDIRVFKKKANSLHKERMKAPVQIR